MNMQKSQQGFTLIELMIVVAIIGILASIALPAYQTYMSKAKFTEVVLATSPVKTAFELCIQEGNSLADCADGGTTSAGTVVAGSLTGASDASNVASVTMATTGLITATAVGTSTASVNGLAGETYVLKPTVTTNNSVTWATDTSSTCLAAGLCS